MDHGQPAQQAKRLTLNEQYKTLDEEIHAHVVRTALKENITEEEAEKRVDKDRIAKNRKSRFDHQKHPGNVVPLPPGSLNRSSRSGGVAVAPVGTPAIMAPPKNDKKSRDAARASASRQPTPNPVVGSAGPSSGRSQQFGVQIQEPVTFESVLETHAGPAAPESNIIGKLSEKSTRALLQSKKSSDELKSGLSKSREAKEHIVEGSQADIDRKAAGSSNERNNGDKKGKSKRKKPDSSVADRPLTHGAHAVAVQDGSHIDRAGNASGAARDPDDASSSLSPAQATPAAAPAVEGLGVDMDVDGQEDDSMDDVQPLPSRVVLEAPTFGDDPTTFPDPTEYEIRKVQPGMSEEEIKHYASVASYPRNDISHLTAGSPPDKDFTKGKPTNQVQASTFATHVEPYLRPFTEEDMAWLRERGDRRAPFIMPALGKKTYKAVWAEEDGVEVPKDPAQKSPNNATPNDGDSMAAMNDNVAETDKLQTGGVMSRLMSLYRVEDRPVAESSGNNGVGGGHDEEDTGDNDDLAAILEGSSSKPANSRAPLPPATRIAEPATEPGRSYTVPKLTSQEADQRALQELRFAGLMPETAEPNYAASEGDQVAARLRELQARLKTVQLQNAARKSILQERMPDQMAFQEYTHIGDDLDAQVTSAYQKRTRTMSKKGKKRAAPGGGFGAGSSSSQGVAKPAVDSATKAAMERRREWKEKVGPVFEGQELGKVPSSSIFTEEAMAKHMAKEAALWDEEEGDDAEDE